MPITIPTLDAPRVDSRGLSTPFESTNHSAGEQGAALAAQALKTAAGVANDVQGVLQKAKEQADKLAVQEALNAQKAFNNAAMESVRRAEGRNAAAAAQKYYEEADKKAKELYAGLANDDQRRLFTPQADEELTQSQKVTETHVGQQIKWAEDNEFKIANEQSLRDAARDGADLPDVMVREVGKVEQRTLQYAKDRGLDDKAARSMADAEVGKLYLAQTRVLMSRGRYKEAETVLNAHGDKMGQEADGLRARVTQLSLEARGDTQAQAILDQHKQADGTYDLNAALAQADAKYEAGPEREATRKALVERAQLAAAGRRQEESQNWEKGLGAYMSLSPNPAARSVYLMKKTHPDEWNRLTAPQQHALEQMMLADRRAAKADREGPLSDAELKALHSLKNDIADRPEFYATAPDDQLFRDQRFTNLPERYRERLLDMVTQTKRDRTNPAADFKSNEFTIRNVAREDGAPLAGTRGKKFEQWTEDEQQAWVAIEGDVQRQIASFYLDPDNKGKRVPPELVEKYTRNAIRSGTIKDGRWYAPNQKNVKPNDPRVRALGPTQTYVPNIAPSEEAEGREVLRKQKVSEVDMTPERILQASLLKRKALAGPNAQQKEEYVRRLKAVGAEPLPERVQEMYEADLLGYQQE